VWNEIKEEDHLAGVPSVSPPDRLPLVSALYLLAATIGAALAIREDLPGEFAGRTSGHSASADFFRGTGTALSPGLAMLSAQSILTVLSTRGGKAGTAGVAGLTLLGIGATVGMLGEPIAYRVLSPKGFDPLKAVLVLALLVLPSSMSVLGMKRLLAIRNGR
jgi:hypothetical protein